MYGTSIIHDVFDRDKGRFDWFRLGESHSQSRARRKTTLKKRR